MAKVLAILLLLPFVILALVALLIYVPAVQNMLRGKAIGFLEKKIGTPVQLDHLSLRFPIGVSLDGLLVHQQNGDTLLYAGSLKTRASFTSLLHKEIFLSSVELSDVRVTVAQDRDSVFNFDYIIAAFKGDTASSAEPADTTGGWDFSIGEVSLEHITADLHLKPSRMDMALRVGALDVGFDDFDPAALKFHVDELSLENTRADMRMASGPSTPDTYPDLVNPFAGLDIRFSKLALENVQFTMKDVVKGDSLWLDLPDASLTADHMDLSQQLLALEEVKLDGPVFGMITSRAALPSDTVKTDPPWLDQNDGFRYFLRDMKISADQVEVTNGRIAMYSDSIAKSRSLFDPDRMVFSDADLDLRGLTLSNDSIAADVRNLALTTGPKQQRLALKTALSATPAVVSMKDGTVSIGGTAMDFSVQAMPGDLSTAYRSPDHVPLRAAVLTTLDPDTLRPLLAQFGLDSLLPTGVTEKFNTSLAIAGSIAQLDSARLNMDGDQGSVVHLRAKGQDLMHWPSKELDADLDAFTLGRGLRQVLEAQLPTGTISPGRLNATAHVHLKAGDLQAKIDIDSDVGRVKGTASATGLNARIPDNIATDLAIDGFQLQRFTGDTAIGPVSLTLTAEGKDLNSASRIGTMELRPSELKFNGQDLSSLKLDGRVNGDSLFVQASTAAKALKLSLDARGKWPRPGDSLALALRMRLDTVHLQELGLMAHTLDVRGDMVGSAAFDTTGLGYFALNADGLRLSNEKQSFRFKTFSVAGRLGADSSAIILNSDALTLAYRTNVAVDSILPRTEEKIASYFKTDTTFHPAPGKYMDLAITLPNSDWLTGLVVPDLHAITLKNFTGHYDSDADELKLNIDIPELDYDSIAVTDLAMNVNANGHALSAKAAVERVTYDSLSIDGLSLTSVSKPGVLESTLRVQQGEAAPSYQLTVQAKREGTATTLHVVPEGMVLDKEEWTADPKNLLRMAVAGGVQAEHFDLHSKEQRVQVVTGESSTRITVSGFRIGTLLDFVSSADSTAFVAGVLNGSVDLPKDRAPGLKADLKVHDLALLGNPMGDLAITANEATRSNYTAQVVLKNGKNTLNGQASVDASGDSPAIHGQADVAFTDLSVFKPFTLAYLYELAGGLNGKLRYDKVGKERALNGDLTFADTRLGILATRSLFKLNKESLHFDDKGIHLKRFTMKDSLDHVFALDGDIWTSEPGGPRFDMSLRTDSFQLVGSKRGDNSLFYGDVLAGLDLTITGTTQLPKLKGDVRILKGTNLSVVMPGSEVKLVSSEGIVVFTDSLSNAAVIKQEENGVMLRDSLNAHLKGYELDLRLRVDKNALFSVVLDPTTGDEATFQGDGDLHFTYNARGDMTLSGPFTFSKGDYTLEFYGLVKKHFSLVKGSSVMWNGDPLQARLAIKASYRSVTAPYALVAGSEVLSDEAINSLQERLPFDVIISVDGRIDKPGIGFGIDLEREYRNSYPSVSTKLDELALPANADERDRQVFALLVLNTFIPDESASTAPTSSIATTAARSSVNGILTDQLNKLTGQFVKGVDVSFGVNTVDQASGGTTYQRTSVDYKVSKSFLNDRLSFEVGGSVGVDNKDEALSAISNTRTAQYVVYYNLTPDGKYRLRGFYENSFDLYDGEITDSGVAIQYTKEFEENERARNAAREAERKRREQERQEQEKQRDARENAPTPAVPPGEDQ